MDTGNMAQWGAVIVALGQPWVIRWLDRRRRRPSIEVTCRVGFLAAGAVAEPPSLSVKAANTGEVQIEVTGMCFRLPDRNQMFMTEARYIPPLPLLLEPGRQVTALVMTQTLANALEKRGYTGVVPLVPVFNDALGGEHEGKPCKFDVEDWSGRPQAGRV